MKQYNAARTYQFRVQVTRDDHRRIADQSAGFTAAPSRNGATHGATVDHLPQPARGQFNPTP